MPSQFRTIEPRGIAQVKVPKIVGLANMRSSILHNELPISRREATQTAEPNHLSRTTLKPVVITDASNTGFHQRFNHPWLPIRVNVNNSNVADVEAAARKPTRSLRRFVSLIDREEFAKRKLGQNLDLFTINFV